MEDLTQAVRAALLEAGAGACAFLTDTALRGAMEPLQLERLDRLIPDRRGIVCIVVPYYVRDGEEAAAQEMPRISQYARGRDYHVVVKEILDAGLSVLQAAGYRGEVLVDASPIPEVRAAAMSGLGVIGRNGLLLTKRWGSWVFIGCLVTDAPLAFEPAQAIRSCADCGACVRACPVGALTGNGVDSASCLSALSQRSGIFTAREAALLREHGVIWGCDRCQEACAANICVEETQIEAFRRDRVYTIPESTGELQTRRELQDVWPKRAFTWKGVRVLQRNLELFSREKNTNLR